MNQVPFGSRPQGGAASPSGKSILDDRRIRLAMAILLAILGWMVVTIVVQPNTTITLTGIPVDYTYDATSYTSKGLSIVEAPEKLVDLTISGDGYTIGSLNQDDFVVYPDWSSVRSSGEKNLWLRVRCVNTSVDGINVAIAGTDNTVNVVFDVVEEKILPVQVSTIYLKVQEGYILYNTALSAETVTLSGPSSELNRVVSCTAEVTYGQELHNTQTIETALRFYDENGSEVQFDYITLSRESVEVTLSVYKLARLPVSVRFINTPVGFDESVLIYSMSQTSLRVAGPENVIDTLSDLAVGTIDLATFALDKVYEMPVSLPSGIVCLDNIDTISVSFDCTDLTTKTLNIPGENVQVVNLASTYQLEVETERLMNVVLCGPKEDLETLNAEQVVVLIDADDFPVVLGQQNIACTLYVPSNGKIFALGSYMIQCRITSN